MPEGHHISLTRNPDVLPDELLEDFEPQGSEPLGEGAFAVVRLLRRRRTGELFALKCVEKYPLQIRNMIPQMQREVRIHKALSHPNILQLVRVFDDPNYVFMLLEYCEKGPLRQLVAEAPNCRLPEPEAAFYFDQIVCGVEWMHRNSCVHRDLKLENMLLTAKDEIKICDFGWSAEVEADRLLKTMCGTTAYWPPELWESEPQDEAVDLWALGCLLYEMLASHPPFFANQKQELSTMVLKLHFACPPWFSTEACHLVHCLLKKEPHQRVRSKDLRRHAWLRKNASPAVPLGKRSAMASEAPPPPPPPPPSRGPTAPGVPGAMPPLGGRKANPEPAAPMQPSRRVNEPQGRAPLPAPPPQANLSQPLQSPGKPLLFPAPKLAAEANGLSPQGAQTAPEQGALASRPALRNGQTLPLDRRPGTTERRIAWELPTARKPMSPGSAVVGGIAVPQSLTSLGPQSLGWEEAVAAVREAGLMASAAATAAAAIRVPSQPQTDKLPRSPLNRGASKGPQQLSPQPQQQQQPPPPQAYSPSRTRAAPALAPPPTQRMSEPPTTSSGSRFSIASSNSVGKEPAQAPSTSSPSPGLSVISTHTPTSLRLPLPSAHSFPAHHLFSSPEAGCTTPLSSALVPQGYASGKAQSFNVQSPSTSFYLQSMALPSSPVPRSPGTPLAHSNSGSLATVATPGGAFAPPHSGSGSVVVRHQPSTPQRIMQAVQAAGTRLAFT